jgi:hypothetical protein
MFGENKQIILKQKMAFERLFQSAEGKLILKILADKCIPHMGTYDPDMQRVAFREGQRNVFLTILKLASIETDKFLKEYDYKIGEE